MSSYRLRGGALAHRLDLPGGQSRHPIDQTVGQLTQPTLATSEEPLRWRSAAQVRQPRAHPPPDLKVITQIRSGLLAQLQRQSDLRRLLDLRAHNLASPPPRDGRLIPAKRTGQQHVASEECIQARKGIQRERRLSRRRPPRRTAATLRSARAELILAPSGAASSTPRARATRCRGRTSPSYIRIH